ncbi:hypothetical protein LCGC14_1035070 [marine sediment metagenome]|uniref:Uncharacterized protein n=1 Tax=marine sediment metagenome TaxID=412755 RepID=A0A0F9MTH0_9ZZZZ
MTAPLSGAMRDLMLRLLHHGNATLLQKDRTAEALIRRGLAEWMTWDGKQRFKYGNGRLALSREGLTVARKMKADGARRDALTEQGLRDLVIRAIEFADSEDLFRRMGHRVSAEPFYVHAYHEPQSWGLVIKVDDAEFILRVDTR